MPGLYDIRYCGRELRTVRAEGDAPRIRGYAALFNQPAEIYPGPWGWSEEILPGAFDDVLANDVRALFNHDANLVLGRTAANTLMLGVDAVGLWYEITPPDTQFARDLLASIDRGDVSQSSFQFSIAEQRWVEKKDAPDLRQIVKLDTLYDVSPVTFPAYPDTTVSSRSMEAFQAFKREAAAGGAAGQARRARTIQIYQHEV